MSTTLLQDPYSPRLRNRVSLTQTVSHSLSLTWRGLPKIKRAPEQLIDETVQPVQSSERKRNTFYGCGRMLT